MSRLVASPPSPCGKPSLWSVELRRAVRSTLCQNESGRGGLAVFRFIRFGGFVGAFLCSQALGQFGPSVSCTGASSPAPVYASGMAEPLADISIRCAVDLPHLVATDFDLEVEVAVALNTRVANRVGFGSGVDIADAVLVVNGNDCDSPAEEGSAFGTCGAGNASVQDPQYGRRSSVNTVVWSNVTLPFRVQRSAGLVSDIRIRAMRGDASQLRVAPGGHAASPPITASLSLRSPGGVVLRNGVLRVGQPLPGLGVSLRGEAPASACLGSDRGRATVHLREGFARAFRTQSPDSLAGNAASATRFALDFEDIPEDMTVSVPPSLACYQPEFEEVAGETADALTIGLVRGHDSSGRGGTATTGSGSSEPTAAVTLNGGRGQAVYEVLAHDPGQVEDCHIPLRFETESGSISRARAKVSAGFAPRGASELTTSMGALARFAQPNALTQLEVDLAACGTALLFPFVSNQGGFDTGVVITHGSGGTLPDQSEARSGACDINYYGTNAEGQDILLLQHSTNLEPGHQLVFTVSGGNPTQNILGTPQYQGYLVAECGYPDARGYAFISDGFGGIADLGMGYIAPVIPLDSRGRRLALPERSR